MKKGDRFPINLEQWAVAEAEVVSVDGDQVTLDIPATRVVMGVRTSLTDLEPQAPEKDHIILDEVKPTAPAPTPQASNTPDESSVVQDSAKGYQESQAVPVPSAQPAQSNDSTLPAPKRELSPDDIGDGMRNVAFKEMD